MVSVTFVSTLGLEPRTPTMSRWYSNQLSYADSLCCQNLRLKAVIVRLIRLELTRLAAPDPKSGVSTNSTTSAAVRALGFSPLGIFDGAKVRLFCELTKKIVEKVKDERKKRGKTGEIHKNNVCATPQDAFYWFSGLISAEKLYICRRKSEIVES